MTSRSRSCPPFLRLKNEGHYVKAIVKPYGSLEAIQEVIDMDEFTEASVRQRVSPHPFVDVVMPLPVIPSSECLNCRGADNVFLFQLKKHVKLCLPLLHFKATMVRMFHLSQNNSGNGEMGRNTWDLSILDFLSCSDISEDLMPYIPFLGFNCLVRIIDKHENDETKMCLTRAYRADCNEPAGQYDLFEIMKHMRLYNGMCFDEFKLVRCPTSTVQFLEKMGLAKDGYRVVRIVKPFSGDPFDKSAVEFNGIHHN